MRLRSLFKIVPGLLIFIAVVIGLTSINHPIILKWVTGSAKHHGKPIPATVFANGQVNNSIKVFYTDEANNYLLSLAEYDGAGKLKFINIDLKEKWIGSAVEASRDDYDLIAGHLFQSKTSGSFSPFQDKTRGLNFDPQLSFTDKQIKFLLPTNRSKPDSLRILLP